MPLSEQQLQVIMMTGKSDCNFGVLAFKLALFQVYITEILSILTTNLLVLESDCKNVFVQSASNYYLMQPMNCLLLNRR